VWAALAKQLEGSVSPSSSEAPGGDRKKRRRKKERQKQEEEDDNEDEEGMNPSQKTKREKLNGDRQTGKEGGGRGRSPGKARTLYVEWQGVPQEAPQAGRPASMGTLGQEDGNSSGGYGPRIILSVFSLYHQLFFGGEGRGGGSGVRVCWCSIPARSQPLVMSLRFAFRSRAVRIYTTLAGVCLAGQVLLWWAFA
jgi:hypothetical protein